MKRISPPILTRIISGTVLLVLAYACQRPPTTSQLQKRYPTSIHADRAAYRQARQQYVQRDRALAFDADLVLTAQEDSVNQKLLALRHRMTRQYQKQHFFPPAHYFYRSKRLIERTQLFHILRKMPKGGALHLHPEAAGDLRWVVQQALKTPNCYVFWQKDRRPFVKGQLDFFKPSRVPDGFYSVWSLNKTVPHFADSLYDLLTFDVQMSQPGTDMWQEFEACFQRIRRFMRYQPIFRDFFQEAFATLAEDGIQHVELRAFLGAGLHDLRHPPGYFTSDTLVRYYQEAAYHTQQKYPDFTLKLIYTNHRFQPREVIERDVEKAFRMRRRYPDVGEGLRPSRRRRSGASYSILPDHLAEARFAGSECMASICRSFCTMEKAIVLP